MNILFVTITYPKSENDKSIYSSLVDELCRQNHNVTVLCPSHCDEESIVCVDNKKVVRVKSGQVLGLPIIQKFFVAHKLPILYKFAYKKYLQNDRFDLVIMPTPTVTMYPLLKYIKRRTNAKLYLILRDIYPQSIYSNGVFRSRLVYNYFNRLSIAVYKLSDKIGCMTKGNIAFIKREYPWIDSSKLVLLHNWLNDSSVVDCRTKKELGLEDKTVVVYGGALGKPQKISNIVVLAEACRDRDDIVFIIIGKGLQKQFLIDEVKRLNLSNVIVKDYMPQAEYMSYMSIADVGLISLTDSYTVPQCPSKAVAYMSMGVPIFGVINPNNDFKQFVEDAGAGCIVIGGDNARVVSAFKEFISDTNRLRLMGDSGRKYFQSNLTAELAAKNILSQI